MATWIIRKYDGSKPQGEWTVRVLTAPEIHVMLQRLASRYLTDDEVIDSSVRRNHSGYRPLLEPIGRDIHYGEGIYYIADIQK